MQFKEYKQEGFGDARKVLGLSQQELADICRTTRQTLSAIENGQRAMSSTVIVVGLALEGVAEEQGWRKERIVKMLVTGEMP